MQECCKNRLKRKSTKHVTQDLTEKHADIISKDPELCEPLTNVNLWQLPTVKFNISLDIPGITRKEDMTPDMLKNLTLEHIDKNFNTAIWTHIYTDGSADEAIKNGGGGVYIKFPNGKTISRSIPTGSLSSNFKAEEKAVHEALEILSQEPFPPSHAVIFTDCRSVLQKLSSPEDTTSRQIHTLLSQLSTTTTTSMQWIPAHCNIAGNEKADSLAKCGSKMIQETDPTSYQEIKTIIKRKQKEKWKTHHGVTSQDPWETLGRRAQTTIFRLRTGHCRLNFHLHKINICHTSDCLCGTGIQTPEHILQQCPLHNSERSHFWPHGKDLHQKLWGSREDLQTTAQFITEIGISV